MVEEKFIGFCYSAFDVFMFSHLLPLSEIFLVFCSSAPKFFSLVERGDFLFDLFYLFHFLAFLEFGELHGAKPFSLCIFGLRLSNFALAGG